MSKLKVANGKRNPPLSYQNENHPLFFAPDPKKVRLKKTTY